MKILRRLYLYTFVLLSLLNFGALRHLSTPTAHAEHMHGSSMSHTGTSSITATNCATLCTQYSVKPDSDKAQAKDQLKDNEPLEPYYLQFTGSITYATQDILKRPTVSRDPPYKVPIYLLFDVIRR